MYRAGDVFSLSPGERAGVRGKGTHRVSRVSRSSSMGNLEVGVPIDQRMPNILGAKIRRVTGIPILLKREDAQQQIEIPGHSISAARTRRPNLRRDILDEFRPPIEKGSFMGLEIPLD